MIIWKRPDFGRDYGLFLTLLLYHWLPDDYTSRAYKIIRKAPLATPWKPLHAPDNAHWQRHLPPLAWPTAAFGTDKRHQQHGQRPVPAVTTGTFGTTIMQERVTEGHFCKSEHTLEHLAIVNFYWTGQHTFTEIFLHFHPVIHIPYTMEQYIHNQPHILHADTESYCRKHPQAHSRMQANAVHPGTKPRNHNAVRANNLHKSRYMCTNS